MKNIRDNLVGAVIAFDAKQEARAAKSQRAYHNVYALPQYLRRVDDVMSDIRAGADVGAAVNAGFTPGALRNACRKALALPKDDVEASGSYKGMPVYQKVSDRP
jgi:hypothetical protein